MLYFGRYGDLLYANYFLKCDAGPLGKMYWIRIPGCKLLYNGSVAISSESTLTASHQLKEDWMEPESDSYH